MNTRMKKPGPKARCCFCERPGADLEGFSKKLKPRMAHQDCAEAFAVHAADFARWCNEQLTAKRGSQLEIRTHADREVLRELLSYCACRHPATDHHTDSTDNILECSKCPCRQFKYPDRRTIAHAA